ncbi:ribokinase [Pontivivens ytuae]|uniref:Ribokinase n=1 Tax=Pontivivens ytuae TaxID=2789856 RepID=A0A7S9LSM2_9RHOB|nr:ribokinase [Pontivivens ytuae]QPH54492.1 ribokinase [Pontivivens ytuae]
MIVVFGSINLDLVVPVARLPAPGETVSGGAYRMHPGGKGANQAVAAARAGARVAMIGAVGKDAFAAPALGGLQAAGVDCSGVAEVSAPTGLALIGVAADGENSIIVAPGANAVAKARDLPAGGILVTQNEIAAEAVAEAHTAAQRRLRVIHNAAPAREITADALAQIEILVMNESEAYATARQFDLSRATAEGAAKAIAAAHDVTTVVTLGAQGATAFEGGLVHRVSAPSIIPVDTTGAGDCFTGVLAAGLDAGLPLPDALRRAAVAGALACTAEGAQSAMPDAAAIDKLMR